jgi:hypothetical protein
MATTTAPANEQAKKALKNSTFVILKGEFPLAEHFTHQRFTPGQQAEVSEITPWIQAQIDAGLMEEVK